MLDAILDLFDRRRRGDGAARRSGRGGVLDRLGGLLDGDHDDRDRRPPPDRRDDRWSDDDDDRPGRRRSDRRGDGDGFGIG